MIANGGINPTRSPKDRAEVGSAAERLPARRSLASRMMLIVLAFCCSLVITIALIVVFFRDNAPPLDSARLAAAHKLWEQQEITDYRMQLTKLGNRSDEITIEVHGGKPTNFLLNGTTPPQERVWAYWTVPAMFETLEQELSGAEDPEVGFGASPKAEATLRATFDTEYGYPDYYLRTVAPDSLTVGWRVQSFEPLSALATPESAVDE